MANHLVINVKDRTLIKNLQDGGIVELYLNENGSKFALMSRNMSCIVSKTIRIPAGTLESVPICCDLPDLDKDHLLLFTDDTMDPKIMTRAHGIPGVSSVTCKSVLIAAGEKDVVLHKGEKVGGLSSVYEPDDCNESPCESRFDSEIERLLDLSDLSDEHKKLALKSLHKFRKVFSSGESDVGLANVTPHKIKLTSDTPIFQRPRRFPPPVTDEVEHHCRTLNALDILEPSSSPWCSPIVPVRKKDGTLRICIDYRQLNRVTVRDKFPVPNISDCVFGLYGTKFFTRLDLVKGYYQLPIDESSREYTAFSTPRNHWQFRRLSFGLANAPAAFQRAIQEVLSAFPSNKVIIYIDDILIMGTSFEEHLDLVCKVLATLEMYSIKVKLSKCAWFGKQVEFLGHVISPSGVKKTNDYVEKVVNFPKPETVGQLREFLGFINFQRKFLPNCSEIQKPLSCLTSGKKRKKLQWTEEMCEAFDRLKQDMKDDIELAYPNYADDASPLELWVDASALGAGAYLAQEQNGCHRVIGFASMTFTNTQLNYSTLERELTALRWGVKTFRPFLCGVSFILYTDHQPLVYLHNMKLVCSRLARTVEELADYNFEIRYVPGHLNSAADALSRIGNPRPDDGLDVPQGLPSGLVLDGCAVPGGGDSIFTSLRRALSKKCPNVPLTDLELRVTLVDELLKNPSSYRLNLDRNSRKQFKLMRCSGQLPSMDVLLAASKLFKVKLYVYFWSEQPVVYQYENYPTVIHLQCIGGVHFNPLIELNSYCSPELDVVSVNTIGSTCKQIKKDAYDPYDTEDELVDSLTEDLCNYKLVRKSCEHKSVALPEIVITFGDTHLCGIMDTGAEISLVSSSVVEQLKVECGSIIVTDEYVCDIVGFSGQHTAVRQTALMSFSIGSFDMPSAHKFGIIDDDLVPCCLLLGIDFMSSYGIDIDLSNGICKRDGFPFTKVSTNGFEAQAELSLMVRIAEGPNAQCINANEIRLEIEGDGQTISGLTSLMDVDEVKALQFECPELRTLKQQLEQQLPQTQWPGILKPFKRNAASISLRNDVLVFSGNKSVPLVPFNILVDVVLSVHYEFAHIGRDKVIDVVRGFVWHPDLYKVSNDVCTACHLCQIKKEYSTILVPPTIKICSTYPFELVAMDCVSLPQSSSGCVGMLVVTDHYSKWATAIPIKNKRSATIIQSLSQFVFPFMLQLPTRILSDNGPEFASGEFANFLSAWNIAHTMITPHHPSSNGAVERVNRTLLNLLRSSAEGDRMWDKELSKVLVTYNKTIHSVLKLSPSEFLLTGAHNIEGDLMRHSQLVNTWKQGHSKFTSFTMGQLVLLKINHKGFLNVNKLADNFRGPLSITKINDNGLTYEMKDVDSGEVVRGHHTQMRPYKEVPRYLEDNPLFIKFTNGANPHADNMHNDNDYPLLPLGERGPVDYGELDLSSSLSGASTNDSSTVSSSRGFERTLDDSLSVVATADTYIEPVQAICRVIGCRSCEPQPVELESELVETNKTLPLLNSDTITQTAALPHSSYHTVLDWEQSDERWSSFEIDPVQEIFCDEKVGTVSYGDVDQSFIELQNIDPIPWSTFIDRKISDTVKRCISPDDCSNLAATIDDCDTQHMQSESSVGTTQTPEHNTNNIQSISNNDISFEGFNVGDALMTSTAKLDELLNSYLSDSDVSEVTVIERLNTSDLTDCNIGPITRSRGKVENFPNVQPKVLEHKTRSYSD